MPKKHVAKLAAASIAAAAALPLLAQPASAATYTYQVGTYKTSGACATKGKSMVSAGTIISYTCKWDSPYWALIATARIG
ncbi:hypothetical protein [Actinomadura parmotrematis]|uniref:Secreted protein n=1 Tax=Actinomadura parmotrematis TaxID=2864039 RepID=A0ABS7FRZ3_9ACTN|nr:hypothetical protein [Actinomadura parmotrematis]MBW8482322.1 hypothetical protein [Actinomadura parmotrematis]